MEVYWGYSSGAPTTYTLEYREFGTVPWSTVTTVAPSDSTVLSGLLYGTQYEFRVKAGNSYGSSAYTSAATAYTLPKRATLAYTNFTGTAVTINISGMVGNWTSVRVNLYRNGVFQSYRDILYGATATTFTGLTGGYTYTFTAATYHSLSGLWSGNSNTLSLGTVRPMNFSWMFPKVQGDTCVVGAVEWNAFCNRINLFREYKGVANYAFIDVSTGEDFAYTIFNNARTALNALSAYFTGGNTMPPAVTNNPASSTSDVVANYFNQLVDCMNSIL
jgi:hypothetical protein